jgi:hypothetical protein
MDRSTHDRALHCARKAGRAFAEAHATIRAARKFNGDRIFVTAMVRTARQINRNGVLLARLAREAVSL